MRCSLSRFFFPLLLYEAGTFFRRPPSLSGLTGKTLYLKTQAENFIQEKTIKTSKFIVLALTLALTLALMLMLNACSPFMIASSSGEQSSPMIATEPAVPASVNSATSGYQPLALDSVSVDLSTLF